MGVADPGRETRPLSRVRRIIAQRMLGSLHDSAQLTSVVAVDMSAVMAARARAGDAFRGRHGVGLGPLPVVARAVCVALAMHPELNARIDMQAGTATYFGGVNLGVAVDTEVGLMVPNLRDAQELTVAGLARGVADLAARARSRRLTVADLEGGTFTITNTGSRGSLLDTPILNAPEVGILALGKIERRPVVIMNDAGTEAVGIRDMGYLSLTYDHRLVDGANAARFLADVKRWVEAGQFAAELELGDD